jgi:hypothetical protein
MIMGNELKIGDKVRIRNDLKGDTYYGGLYFDSGMEKFNGETHEIVEKNTNGNYLLDIDIEERHYWVWNDAMVELVEKGFTKADLKPGMVVEYRNGSKAVFINDIFMEKHGWMPISDYYDDLINVRDLSCSSHYDICRVYNSKAFAVDNLLKPECLELIWERKEDEPVKEMTVAEIEKKLGYKVKIVDGE